MSKKKQRKVEKFKKPFNIANVFFGAILIYMIIYLYMFLTSVHISGYEVIKGSLATDKQFSGLVLRTEEVFYAPKTGHIEYYAAEGSKVSQSSIIYSVGTTEKMSEHLTENSEKPNLSEEHFNVLNSDINSFSNGYDRKYFSEVYDFHDTINGNILELVNHTLLEKVEDISDTEKNAFQRIYGQKSGIIGYYIDNLEAVTPATVTPDMFEKNNYPAASLRSVEKINEGDIAYKLITDENWSMIIPMSAEQIDEIAYQEKKENEELVKKQRSVVEVKFLKDNTTTWGYVNLLDIQGTQYLQLNFNNSMVRFAGDRYLDIEFLIDDTSGLKIPTSSITTKEFFVIPEEYVVKGGEKNSDGFIVERFDEEGHSTQKFIAPTFYSIVDGMVYVDPNQSNFETGEIYIKAGDRVIASDSNDLYQIGNKGELEGVYCINQGYTQFRKIKILYANEEYTIVEEGTSHGLTIYDRIVLNAEAVDEEQVIY